MKKPVFNVDGETLSPEEYAALWGCEARYDSEPNKIGDGAMF